MNKYTSLDPDIVSGEYHRTVVGNLRMDRDEWKALAKSSALVNLSAALILVFMLVTWLVKQ